MASDHNNHSSYREKLIEHLFIGELLKLSWLKYDCDLEVAKPEVDNAGYDIIAEANGIVRHIQLKASFTASTTTQQKLHVKLATKPSGCVVWLKFNQETMRFEDYLFYGAEPGKPLNNLDNLKVARHSKGNKDGVKHQRPNIRIINKGEFVSFDTVESLYHALFIN